MVMVKNTASSTRNRKYSRTVTAGVDLCLYKELIQQTAYGIEAPEKQTAPPGRGWEHVGDIAGLANGEQTNRSEQQQNDTLGDQLLTNRKLRDHNNVVLEGIDYIGCKDLAELHCDQNVRQQKQRKLPRLPQGDPPKQQHRQSIHEDVTQRECCFRKISIDKIICQPLQQAGGQKSHQKRAAVRTAAAGRFSNSMPEKS